MLRKQLPKISLVKQAFIGFLHVNPSTFADHRPIKSQEMILSILGFESKQPKKFLTHCDKMVQSQEISRPNFYFQNFILFVLYAKFWSNEKHNGFSKKSQSISIVKKTRTMHTH